MLDYGYNFMQTKIHVDNESAICVVKNPVYHSKTKHIEIRHHFIRDSYEKRLIEMVKIHTDNNVADLLTKAFDGRLMVFKCSGVYTSAIWIEVGMDYNCVERAITTAASLDAAQDSDNIIRTQTTAMPNVDIPQGMDTGGSPRRQDTIGVKKLERKRKSSISHPRRRKYIQVETSSNDGLDEEDASKQGRRRDKLEPMFNDKDLEELDDYIENVEEETVDVAATGVTTVSAQVSTAGVTISTDEPRTPPITTTVFDDKDVTMAMAQTLIRMKEMNKLRRKE
ncbi:hypothetical protein Tco_0298570 [Tanacetum coccineum]